MSCRSRRRPTTPTSVRFGTHQFREKVDTDNLVYVTWFAGGLRIMDINDPANPEGARLLHSEARRRRQAPLTNDIYKDDRGLLFVTDKKRGLDVIEFKG